MSKNFVLPNIPYPKTILLEWFLMDEFLVNPRVQKVQVILPERGGSRPICLTTLAQATLGVSTLSVMTLSRDPKEVESEGRFSWESDGSHQ